MTPSHKRALEAFERIFKFSTTRYNGNDKDAEIVRAALTQGPQDVSYRGLCEIREIYCNMEGFEPETAAEAYVLQEIKRMYDTAVEHINTLTAGGVLNAMTGNKLNDLGKFPCPDCGAGELGLCETCYIRRQQPDYNGEEITLEDAFERFENYRFPHRHYEIWVRRLYVAAKLFASTGRLKTPDADYVLVPREPTKEMINAANRAFLYSNTRFKSGLIYDSAAIAYEAMISEAQRGRNDPKEA